MEEQQESTSPSAEHRGWFGGLPEKGQPNVQAAGKRMVSGSTYIIQAELCICNVYQFKDKTIPERVRSACRVSRALADDKWFIPLGLLKARFTER